VAPPIALSFIPLAGEVSMPIKQFEPQYMKIGVLTAAFQELTPREIRG
jgi:hypothetical protein